MASESRQRSFAGSTSAAAQGRNGRDLRRVPGVWLVHTYRRRQLIPDLWAAVAVTALMVPHGMAYAELAGVPAVTGLYTTVTAVLVYAAFGPSRNLLLGPDSSLAPLIAAGLALVLADGDPAAAVAAAGILALMTGGLCLLAGLLRLGYIAELLSRPVQLGYLNGLAVVMVVSQLPKLFGFSAGGDTVPEILDGFASGIADGRVNTWSLAIGLVSIVVILVIGRRWRRFPGVLLAVVVAILTVEAFDLVSKGVPVVGEIPRGFPSPSVPSMNVDWLWPLFLASFGLTWVTLADTTALSRGMAARDGERIDPNTEIMALGASNAAVGLFQGFPVSASTSRTATSRAAGGTSQLVGVISAVFLIALLLLGAGALESMPGAVLAAVVVAAAVHLFDHRRVLWLVKARRSEAVLCIAASVGVVLVGVLNGILIAVAFSLVNFVRTLWRPYDAVLGRIEKRRGYHDVDRHPNARTVPGLVLFRFDAPLFFANADYFTRRIREIVATRDEHVKRIVVAAEPITDIDTTGSEALEQLLDELDDAGIELGFAELKGPVRDRLANYGLADRALRFDDPTVGKAVSRYVRDHGVKWKDWTD